MPALSFLLTPESVAQIHDLLSCLARFDENITLEATADHFRFSSLNVSKTALASFKLDPRSFFTRYHFSSETRNTTSTTPKRVAWTCQLQNRALLSIFKRRLADGKDRETALEHCEVDLDAKDNQPECRLIVKMVCRHGVIKTYRLTYESAEASYPSFDKANSTNNWTISSKTLRDVVEYFGPKTDQLDWCLDNGKVTFTSYTDKIQVGKEILKQPIHTSVALEQTDFDNISLEEKLHIGISVKDFRAIVGHAEISQARVTATYSQGNRPMQITYYIEGVLAEYTLMTRRSSDATSSSTTASTPARGLSMKPISQPTQSGSAPSIATNMQAAGSMAPPTGRATVRDESTQLAIAQPVRRNSPTPPTASLNPQSLFIPVDLDQQWDEPNYDEPDQVTWAHESELPADSGSTSRIRDSEPTSFQSVAEQRSVEVQGIAPTQRLSQIPGLFD